MAQQSRFDRHDIARNKVVPPSAVTKRKSKSTFGPQFVEPKQKSRFDNQKFAPQTSAAKTKASPQRRTKESMKVSRFESVSPTDIRIQTQQPTKAAAPIKQRKASTETIEWSPETHKEEAAYNGHMKARQAKNAPLALQTSLPDARKNKF